MAKLTTKQQERAEELFEQALDVEPESRRNFVESSGSEPAVKEEVQSLLGFHATAQDRLDTAFVPTEAIVEAVDKALEVGTASSEPDPTTIGPYKIIKSLGEGGMGSVYLAEQEKPLRRRVAIKLIKLGMDTRGVIARFDVERQALALMNHPNVARALDAGSTEDGRPYFVMEYVEGVRITEYCDTNRLDVSARLALFAKVCDAIQHAHQKGIIHRDIKPSNVIVCQEDGHAIPKVIDFGVAKATNQRLTERTLFTERGMLIGTPEYMSPEQAKIDNSDVDTRSDIYSLGVLLYELLVGALPIDTEALRQAGMDELQRLVREHDPPKPTTRLVSLGDEAIQRAHQRGTELPTLIRKIRGDLDWIVMKCLEKDRDRRYAATAELVDDLNRFAQHQPVTAGPPSVTYRMRKFTRRNRGLVLASSIILAVLATGVVSTGTFALAESRQRTEAQSQARIAQAVNDFLNDMLASVDPRAEGPDVTVRQILDESSARIEADLSGLPAVERGVRGTIGRSYLALGLYAEAEPHLQRAMNLAVELYGEERAETTASMHDLGVLLRALGRYAEAEVLHRRALEIDEALHGEESVEAATSMNDLAQSLYDQGKYNEGRPLYERAYKIRSELLDETDYSLIASMNNLARERYVAGEYAEAEAFQQEAYRLMAALFGEEHIDTVGQICNVAFMAMTRGNYDEAERLFRDGLRLYRKIHGGSHADVARTINNLAECMRRQGRHEEAAALHREGLAMRRETLGNDHPMVANSLNNLALALTSLEQYEEATKLHLEALAIRRERLGERHPSVATSLNNSAFVSYKRGAYEQAMQQFQEALSIRREAFGDQHPHVANTQMNMARCLHKMNEPGEAESLCRAALEIQTEKLGEDHPHTAATMRVLASILIDAENYEEAESLLLAALRTIRSKFGDQSSQAGETLEEIVALYDASGQNVLANRYRDELEANSPP